MRNRLTERITALVVAGAFLGGCSSSSMGNLVNGGPLPAGRLGQAAPSAFAGTDAYDTAVNYVVTFYPLWFTYEQWKISSVNQLIGPRVMDPIYHAVVAPNDDTLYANSVVDLTKEPLILTIPATKDIYSVLSTDAFGDVNETGIKDSGTYGLTGPNWKGKLPAGLTQVSLTTNFSGLIIRADKYSPEGENEKAEAERFRRNLHAAPLALYLKNHAARPARIVSVLDFSAPFKQAADELATDESIAFLGELQKAVASGDPPALTPSEQRLSDHFNALFNVKSRNDSAFIDGTRKAHELILNRYLDHLDKNNWISFATIGTTWGRLVRSSISEFIQYGNSHATAAYYQTFKDGTGKALDGRSHQYVLTFSKDEIPQTQRFWSVTGYLPDSITLIKNSANKYLIGSYTPGLQKSKDGSISLYMAQRRPKDVPAANWLPVPKGQFNLMLRVYGPEGRVAHDTYIPPAVVTR
jgi:hypothetical protein